MCSVLAQRNTMTVPGIKPKPSAAKQQPNLLDQIGKAWNDLMGGKKVATPRVKKKPSSVVSAPASSPASPPASKPSQPKPKNTQPAVKQPPTQGRMEAAKREAAAFAQGFLSQAAGTAVQDRQTLNKLGSVVNDLRSGNFKKVSQSIVRTAQNPQLANGHVKSIASVMAHSGIGGVKNFGQTMKGVADASDSLINMVKAAPKFVSDTSDLFSGRTKTSKRDVAAGSVSGTGKVLYGAAASPATSSASQMMPGYGSDFVSYTVGHFQKKLDDGYRSEVKKLGVNPDSKGY
jgi:hypothetical protein